MWCVVLEVLVSARWTCRHGDGGMVCRGEVGGFRQSPASPGTLLEIQARAAPRPPEADLWGRGPGSCVLISSPLILMQLRIEKHRSRLQSGLSLPNLGPSGLSP